MLGGHIGGCAPAMVFAATHPERATSLAGTQLEFESRGTHSLKGVPGRWEVFALAR